ncbi:hypothetical protein CBR_g39172 [Chara braunii]|uniref:Uncharacterized protein n=1 Tax=Chara braunii TaxID=69332 RepID=A0A388LR40_CHABU|nr:hypothetical protein CBR_g39172 [Chara braunii]|eukprot:GBG84796.1 hypothetical protein CBR_g39172 [Chara braunii]
MLDIIWWLEDGPDPQLEACIDRKRAEAMMSTCYDLFAEGRNLRYKLEDQLKGKDDLEGEDWQEDRAQGDEVNSSISISINNNNIKDNNNINNNNDYNNNNNDNNNSYNDNNNDDNININNQNVNNNTYNGSAEHGSSGVENGARAYLIIVSDMGEMPHVTVEKRTRVHMMHLRMNEWYTHVRPYSHCDPKSAKYADLGKEDLRFWAWFRSHCCTFSEGTRLWPSDLVLCWSHGAIHKFCKNFCEQVFTNFQRKC